MSAEAKPSGPDLKAGVISSALREGAMLLGQVDGEAVLLARSGGEVFAVGATCTHYNGPLAEGIIAGDTVRCPWHHACFSLRTGEALRAPAFNPVPCWRVEESGGQIFVRDKLEPAPPRSLAAIPLLKPNNIVIIGGGAAGFAAAEMLRREGFMGGITILSADDSAPYDRPNLSKDYIAGTVPDEWIPLRPDEYYAENNIALLLGVEATEIDAAKKEVKTADGRIFPFDRLLIATGAEPNRLSIPGSNLPHVHTLRSWSDSRGIVAGAQNARSAAVIGASFIGLEVAGALRHRGLEVHVVAPDEHPMEKILGRELSDFIRRLHEDHGVLFHLGHTPKSIEADRIALDDGASIAAGLVAVGIGVRPRLDLARRAGLAVDNGVLVNEYLETSVPGIFAAGDIAQWPDAYSGQKLRIEHWVVAERQGQVAARNMLGQGERFALPPFFWSQHYDVAINYVGHASQWDRLRIDGDIKSRDAEVRYEVGGRALAVATVFRDRASLAAEVAMEHGVSP